MESPLFPRFMDRLHQYKRKLREELGSLLIINWTKVDQPDVTGLDERSLPEIVRMYQEDLGVASTGHFYRYARLFSDLFYVIEKDDEIAGYCVYYIRPTLSRSGIEKVAVLYYIRIQDQYLCQGIGKQLMKASISEMQLNGISSILLCVDRENTPALNLYSGLGFLVIGENNNTCMQGKACYRMQLRLAGPPRSPT